MTRTCHRQSRKLVHFLLRYGGFSFMCLDFLYPTLDKACSKFPQLSLNSQNTATKRLLPNGKTTKHIRECFNSNNLLPPEMESLISDFEHFSLCKWYQFLEKKNKSAGYLMEMIRYINCEFSYIHWTVLDVLTASLPTLLLTPSSLPFLAPRTDASYTPIT